MAAYAAGRGKGDGGDELSTAAVSDGVGECDARGGGAGNRRRDAEVAAAVAAAAEVERRRRRGAARRKHCLCRSLIVLTMAAGVSAVVLDMVVMRFWLGEESRLLAWKDEVMGWIRDHLILGAASLVGLLAVAALCFFPLSLLTLGAGFVYADAFGLGAGVGFASAFCFLGAYLGAVLSFARARYMTRDLVKKFSGRFPVIRAVDNAFKTRGLHVLLLFRLSPVVPYNALNYIGGITGATWEDFCLSLLGIIPDTAFTAFIGATAGSMADGFGGENRWIVIGAVGFGTVTGALGIAAVGVYARGELRRIVLEEAGAVSPAGGGGGGGGKTEGLLQAEAGGEDGGGGVETLLGPMDLKSVLAKDLYPPPPPPRGRRGPVSVDGDDDDDEDYGDEEWFWVYV